MLGLPLPPDAGSVGGHVMPSIPALTTLGRDRHWRPPAASGRGPRGHQHAALRGARGWRRRRQHRSVRHHGGVRLLVLGGTWFVGRVLAALAGARGWEVTCFNWGRTGHDVPGVESVRGDRTVRADLEAWLRVGRGVRWWTLAPTSRPMSCPAPRSSTLPSIGTSWCRPSPPIRTGGNGACPWSRRCGLLGPLRVVATATSKPCRMTVGAAHVEPGAVFVRRNG